MVLGCGTVSGAAGDWVWRGVAAGVFAGCWESALAGWVYVGGDVCAGCGVRVGDGACVRRDVLGVVGLMVGWTVLGVCGSVVLATGAAPIVGVALRRSRAMATGGAVTVLSWGKSSESRVVLLPGMPSRVAARARWMRAARIAAVLRVRDLRLEWLSGGGGVVTRACAGSAPSSTSRDLQRSRIDLDMRCGVTSRRLTWFVGRRGHMVLSARGPDREERGNRP